MASVLVLRAVQEPIRVLCTREIQKSIKDSVKRLLDDEIERAGFDTFFESTDTEIRGANGSLILFAGLRSNIDSIKSIEGIDLCWVEEAQTISQTSLDVLKPTIRKPGSQIYFTWNPKNANDPVENMFSQEEKPPRTYLDIVNWDKNPWFPDVLREEMEHDLRVDPGKHAHVWGGEYLIRSNATVFKNWRVELFETPADAIFRYGLDFGYSVDPSILLRCYVVGRRLYFDYEAYEVGCETVNLPDLLLEVPEAEKWTIVADSSRPETISHLRRSGFKVKGAVKGARSIEEGIEFMRSHEIIVHPRCRHIIDELTHYKYKTDPLTDEVLPILEDKNNHCIDAARYALEALRRTGKTPPVEEAPQDIPVEMHW